MDKTLTVVIPARNEIFLAKTIENILENIEGETDIIAVLDGYWPDPPVKDHPKVTLLHYTEPVGQRKGTNQAVRLSNSKYIMKVDAHCAFDKGFDVKMMNLMEDDITMVPMMRNLHAFDWVCKNGHRRYQGQSGVCTECGEPTERDIVWVGKHNPQSTAYRFDRTMHFQYWREFGKRQTGDLTETMSIQGSCFMVTREKYWELDLCSEEFSSWGQQGVEVACKTWLSGGRILCNRTTWYAHLFRTQGGDFGFPYENPESKIQANRELSRELFERDGWKKAIHPFSWLLEKFNPPDWSSKGILYYTDNQLNIKLAKKCRKSMMVGLPITSVSLKPIDFGKNIHFKGERGKLTMFKQMLAGLEAMTEEIVFFCEHDVIYHPSHFDFTPKDKFYYNENNWRVRLEDGHAVYFDHDSLSQMCCKRELALKEIREMIKRYEAKPFAGGFEPGTKDGRSERWRSSEPNIDIRHSNNFTPSRWSPDKFRDKTTCTNWKEGNIKDLWIKEI